MRWISGRFLPTLLLAPDGAVFFLRECAEFSA
jgi:hypothetical protein